MVIGTAARGGHGLTYENKQNLMVIETLSQRDASSSNNISSSIAGPTFSWFREYDRTTQLINERTGRWHSALHIIDRI
jgi:hypothetical protein